MTVSESIARLHREQWGRVVAAIVRTAGDLYLEAARGAMLTDLGRPAEAVTAYERALANAVDDEQAGFLRARIAAARWA
ncbi:hypothetical protein MU582_08175 [Nocardioidaceae bacterium SCSIO 66511]|nr:hypothetical protein MU582_08175 [Nocardioidaceae bacterium SCSIO 66511]